MSEPTKLPVTWIHQKPGLCGAACAQMILHAFKKVSNTGEGQDALWLSIQGNTVRDRPNPAGSFERGCPGFDQQICEACIPDAIDGRTQERFCWCTFPTALAATLSQMTTARTYQVVVASEEEITPRIIANVQAQTPPAVLAYGRRHWVVVYGYARADSGIVVGGESIDEVLVHNPLWQAPKDSVTIRHWTARYLQEIDCGHFSHRRVMVGNPVLPPFTPQPPVIEPGDLPVLARSAVLQRAKAEAARLTQADSWGSFWREAFEDAQTDHTLLVRELDRPAAHYYIVDFRTHARSTGRMLLDGRSGEVQEKSGVELHGESLPTLVGANDILPLVQSRQFTYRDGHTIQIDASIASVENTLVWKPCDQSRTPFLAFYVVNQGGDRVYVRTDGAMFPELTDRWIA